MHLEVDGKRGDGYLQPQGMDGDREASGEEREGNGWGAGRAERSEKGVGCSTIITTRRDGALGDAIVVFYASEKPW